MKESSTKSPDWLTGCCTGNLSPRKHGSSQLRNPCVKLEKIPDDYGSRWFIAGCGLICRQLQRAIRA